MISHIQVEYLQDWLLYDTDFDWRVQKDKGGESRAVADIGSHCFDTIQFITGEKIVSVYAMFHKQYQKYDKAGKYRFLYDRLTVIVKENLPVSVLKMKMHTVSMRMATLSLVITQVGGKSGTCSFKLTFLAPYR